ncbi:hypothetical protein HOO34_09045 [Aliarcobacter cryaerophilus]|uniref:Uncharacterized protein n=1 Tax=Aliarcobacter cryaerophilus TaxID=28198 RepID=A0A7G9LMB3_9BACT|nr:hypothetical protein [Aliarcobacter cryaerophilus]QNM89762.1 hypothetical protein HOO34_09045 [Aliarcobacter cryaerophilus]
MYCFLNQFSFEYHRTGISEEEIKSTLEDLVNLLNKLSSYDINLIFNSSFSNVKINGQELKYHITKKLEQKAKIFLLKKIDSGRPFCSDSYDEYSNDEKIVLECKEKNENIDIVETFLACALHIKAPIITADKFCSKAHYFTSKIKIDCKEEGIIRELDNYKLSEYEQYLDKLKLEKYKNTNDWNDYINLINDTFKKVRITKECKVNFEIYSFDSPDAKQIRNEIERFEFFLLERQDKVIANLNFKELDRHISEESYTKQSKKKAQLTSKDINGNSMVMSWHSRVNGDFRQYFYFDDNLVYFTMYCKKIPDP